MCWSIFCVFHKFQGDSMFFYPKFQTISRVQAAKINSRLFKGFKEVWEPCISDYWMSRRKSSLQQLTCICILTSNSACFCTSSALILLRMNSASLATLTMWSLVAWDSSLPSLTSSMNARPACFCKEFCHSWEHSNITNSTTDVLCLRVTRPAYINIASQPSG